MDLQVNEVPGGRISFFSQAELICIEYPGYVRSVDNMLKTLGGAESVSKTYLNTKDRLELRYRPNDPSCKCTFGQLHKIRGLLLKVKRKRRRKAENGGPGPWIYEQKILGIVNAVYRFESMVDFQYLTPPNLVDPYKSLFGRELLHRDEKFFPLPKFFTRIDTPGLYRFKGSLVDLSARSSRVFKMQQDMSGDYDSVMRKERKGFGLAALYSNKTIPQEPLQKSKEKVIKMLQDFPVNKKDAEHLHQLLKERPIWFRGAIEDVSALSKEMMKLFLPYYAYYWMNGPWKRLWCRLGYDPRDHPEAYIYQQVECRIKGQPHGSRRKTEALLPVPLRNKKSNSGNVLEAEKAAVSIDVKKVARSFEFHPDKLPTAKQIRYQLCDIYDPEVKELIEKAKTDRCTEQDGFLEDDTITKIRTLLKKRVTAMLESNVENVKDGNDKKYDSEDEDD